MTKPAYFTLAVAALALPIVQACGTKKPMHVTPVPSNCVILKASDFTKVCKPVNPTTAVCDGVVIHYYCTKAAQ